MQVKDTLSYDFQPEKYLFGMCEEFEGSLDAKANAAQTIDLIDALGAKSMRIWMHHTRLLQRKEGSNELEWKQDALARYHTYVDELTRRNIRVLAMSHRYVQPLEHGGTENSMEMPSPDTKGYFEQMKLIAKACEMLAAEFPEILYWECGNEVNMNFYLPKTGACQNPIKNAVYDPAVHYNNLEKAEITADLCYYSNVGVKRGNPNAFVVFPAPTPYRGYAEMAEFFEFTYRAIESGKFPRGLQADTDADHYFQVQCWHAYNFGGESRLVAEGGQMIYDIMKAHGDGGKKVFITEFGYHDSDFVKTRGMTKEQADRTQADFLRADFEAFKSIGCVETVYLFRLYDWIAGPGIEIDFGLFTSPSSEKGIVPKEKGLEAYRIFNGEEADTTALYRYKKA
ncbi:MAG: cellulase family glycosylhydrolase [Clostridia bacterium]|nr:cellulase family glycosylhydrolase [Clostridia bacterium]